mgnify:CR=1 FL=1
MEIFASEPQDIEVVGKKNTARNGHKTDFCQLQILGISLLLKARQ